MNPTTSDRYPRGLPFQPPQVALSQLTQRPMLLAGGGALLLIVAAGSVFFSSGPNAPPPSNDKPVPAATPKTANDRMLETLGGLSAAHLYQSYLNIGLVADAVEKDTYTAAHASQMLTTVSGLMDVVDKQLERLAKMDLGADDKRDVQRIRAISSLMRVQIASLQAFWLTNDQQHAVRYHQTREKAWAGLSEVLGL